MYLKTVIIHPQLDEAYFHFEAWMNALEERWKEPSETYEFLEKLWVYGSGLDLGTNPSPIEKEEARQTFTRISIGDWEKRREKYKDYAKDFLMGYYHPHFEKLCSVLEYHGESIKRALTQMHCKYLVEVRHIDNFSALARAWGLAAATPAKTRIRLNKIDLITGERVTKRRS